MRVVEAVRGDTWERSWTVTGTDGAAVDLTGATARLQVRRVDDGALVVAASSADGRILLDGAAGRLTLVVPAAAMAAVPPGRYRYDCEVTLPAGPRVTIERATLVVSEDIARD